jgi:hypothetical protein
LSFELFVALLLTYSNARQSLSSDLLIDKAPKLTQSLTITYSNQQYIDEATTSIFSDPTPIYFYPLFALSTLTLLDGVKCIVTRIINLVTDDHPTPFLAFSPGRRQDGDHSHD